MKNITPCLWFDQEAEEAVNFYLSIFKNSWIEQTTRLGEDGNGSEGKVMTITFYLDGQKFMALNGGPHFQINEAISFVANCETQEEIDELWEKLSEGGQKVECGWLKDPYGVSWQVVPTVLGEMMSDTDPEKTQRVMQAIHQMKKIEINKLEEAFAQG
ncbi:VOC family protein [Marininema halotolerans]|uniref:Glyoxalase superfamily enzyme, possibly 3-demethylubiquinone-9 3-methyltransferase n=1 Tax=Marininema halotolerans TaxID=1155944 RepID=A0A1I6TUG8_9BACL|nr:VOC family protein [Marininema halotolerans]SFS92815.1 Glyoxalase superfamily enzyme, possibly 3-demethylubiquinone-9 3-methyltransferase [Marininema halotolerans]